MKPTNAAFSALVVVMATRAILAGEIAFSDKLSVTKAGDETVISFAVSAKTDVEVAILDAKGQVVRHLAAGVLGGAKTPPPLKAGLAQELEWDGKDDYGEKAVAGPFTARVRAGMSAKLEKIVGGDPYAFFSRQSGNGDHFQWCVAGVLAKSDGKVYVMGNTTFYGSQVIRQYDAAGNYIKTVFPPPADKPVDEIKGWGVNVRDDGTFTMKNCSGWMGTGVGAVGMSRSRYGTMTAQFISSPDNDTLELLGAKGVFEAKTDGTLKDFEPRPFFGNTKLPPNGLRGPRYTALSPDGKHLFVSGIHAFQRKGSYGRIDGVDTGGFWRDGQVFKIDRATRMVSVFFALDENTVPGDMTTRAKVIGDMNYINPGAAFHGVAVDAEGRVFVCDRLNQRVAVLDESGKLIGELPVKYPDAIGVSPKSRALYVTTRHGDYGGRGKVQLLKFNDWSKDTAPAAALVVGGGVARYSHKSTLAVLEHEGQVLVWVAYTMVPVRIYRDTGTGLELFKDFYESGLRQRALDLQHMQLDRKSGHLYIDAADAWCFRITDWENPKFEVFMDAATQKRIPGANIAIDPRDGYLYTQAFYGQPARRYKIDGDRMVSAPVGDSGNAVTAGIIFGWGFNGLRPLGMAVCPDGSLVTVGNPRDSGRKGDDYGGYVYYPNGVESRVGVIDNAGNHILWFGTYGNRDSAGGLAGDLVPTKDVPMAWPNSVDATDEYIYVSDIVNIRLLRLAKQFQREAVCKIE